jgi:hypothetical protein
MKYNYSKTYFLSRVVCILRTSNLTVQYKKPEVSQASDLPCDHAKHYDMIKKGNMKCLSATFSFTSLTLKGSSLIINGNTIINNLLINKRTILVTEHGSAVLPTMDFQQSCHTEKSGSGNVYGLHMSGSLTDSPDQIICPGSTSELRTASGQKSGYEKANVMQKAVLHSLL